MPQRMKKEIYLMATHPAISARRPHVSNVIPFHRRRAANTWTVSLDGTADFSSIQDAVTAAQDGDVISIAGGMYLESLHVDKAIHLVGPSDPRFVEMGFGTDAEPYAIIMGTGAESINWSANGGSIRDLVITRAASTPESMLTSALIRMRTGFLRVERSLLTDGAHSAVTCRGGEISLVRCHIRNVSVGACILDTAVTLDRTHIEGSEILALHLEAGATATLTENSLEGRTVLRGDVSGFAGNDIDTLFVHNTLGTGGNRISSLVHVCDFRAKATFAIGIQ
jgi:hypothetical protein